MRLKLIYRNHMQEEKTTSVHAEGKYLTTHAQLEITRTDNDHRKIKIISE